VAENLGFMIFLFEGEKHSKNEYFTERVRIPDWPKLVDRKGKEVLENK
jgi:hypothetical protein